MATTMDDVNIKVQVTLALSCELSWQQGPKDRKEIVVNFIKALELLGQNKVYNLVIKDHSLTDNHIIRISQAIKKPINKLEVAGNNITNYSLQDLLARKGHYFRIIKFEASGDKTKPACKIRATI